MSAVGKCSTRISVKLISESYDCRHRALPLYRIHRQMLYSGQSSSFIWSRVGVTREGC
jgi:hypothetical protein